MLLSYSVESDIYPRRGLRTRFKGWISPKKISPDGSHSPKVLFLKQVDTMIKLNSVGPLRGPTLICMWPCEPATWSFFF